MLLQDTAARCRSRWPRWPTTPRCVARGLAHGAAWLIADLPFGSYRRAVAGDGLGRGADDARPARRWSSSKAAMAGPPRRSALPVERGVPVCAHLGLTPQSVHALGGYRVQGRDADSAAVLRRQAKESGRRRRGDDGARADAHRGRRRGSGRQPRPDDHRHRRRPRHRRPGAGDARHARRHPWQTAALRAQLHARGRQHRRRDAALCRRSRTALLRPGRARVPAD